MSKPRKIFCYSTSSMLVIGCVDAEVKPLFSYRLSINDVIQLYNQSQMYYKCNGKIRKRIRNFEIKFLKCHALISYQ